MYMHLYIYRFIYVFINMTLYISYLSFAFGKPLICELCPHSCISMGWVKPWQSSCQENDVNLPYTLEKVVTNSDRPTKHREITRFVVVDFFPGQTMIFMNSNALGDESLCCYSTNSTLLFQTFPVWNNISQNYTKKQFFEIPFFYNCSGVFTVTCTGL